MRAMVLARPRPAEEEPLALSSEREAKAGPGEVLIDIEACGVCRTDLHIVEGEVTARLPVVPGHQVAGRIAGLGAGVGGLAIGEAVGVGWLSTTCGACRFCRSGRENLCEKATFTGRDRNGGFAEQMAAPVQALHRLPPDLPAGEAAPLLCAGIIGYRSLRLSEIRPEGRLGLFGFGASAHLAIQVARHWRCLVYVFTRGKKHQELALLCGATWAGEVEAEPGPLLDAAVIFAPAGELLPLALSRLERGGTLAVNAIHMSPVPSFGYERLYGEKTVRSVTNFTKEDARDFLRLAAEIPVRAEVERFGLEQANEVLLRIKRGEVRGAAVLKTRASASG